MVNKWLRSNRAGDLEWVSRPSEPSRLEGPLQWLSTLVSRLFDRRKEACPFCLRAIPEHATRCPHCREELLPDDPVAALARLGIDWPDAEIERPDSLPESFGTVDPERLRLRELAQELLISEAEPYAVLYSLADPHRSRSIERYPHQVATVRRVLGEMRGRALLADEVGLGKTIEAGLVLAELRVRNRCRRALILAPPALLDQWHEELSEHLNLPVRRVEHPEEWDEPPEIALISSYTAKGPRHSSSILRHVWDLVIFDEAHRLRNQRTQVYRFVRKLRARSLLLLTATPMYGSVLDLYALVDLVRPGFFGTPSQFRARFGITDRGRRIRQPGRLRSALREVMVRNRRATAGVLLPPRRAAVRWVDLSPEERGFYDDAVAALREGKARGGPAVGRLAALQRRLTSTPQAAASAVSRWLDAERSASTLTDSSAEVGAKLWALRELLQQFPEEQMLVFSEFAESVEAAGSQLGSWGESVVWWHGRLGAGARQDALNDFRAGRRRILVGTDALAEGQNLQQCRIVVNLDLPWNPFRIEQRLGRVHRLGQRREVFVLSLVARDTIEAEIARLFIDKLHLFELSVGELDPVIGDMVESEAAFESFLLRIALADDGDRERELETFSRTLEERYMRHRDLTRRQDVLTHLGAVRSES